MLGGLSTQAVRGPCFDALHDQVGPKIGEGSFAVVHKGKEVNGQQRNVAIKIVRSEEELGLGDDDGEGGVSYKDVLRSMRMEMETMEVSR